MGKKITLTKSASVKKKNINTVLTEAAAKAELLTRAKGQKPKGISGSVTGNAVKGAKSMAQAAAKKAEPEYYLPVGNFKISSKYGVDRKTHTHSGIDLALPEGSRVSSVKDGTVSFAGWSNGYGYRVVVDHGDGFETTYNHLSDIGVKKGDKVDAGMQIAKSGNTGHSTGPHLHFEVKKDGSYVNPESYFDFGDGRVSAKESSYTSQLSVADKGKGQRANGSGNVGGTSTGKIPFNISRPVSGARQLSGVNYGISTIAGKPTVKLFKRRSK